MSTQKTRTAELHFIGRLESETFEIVKILVSRKADVNTKDEDGNTPLDWVSTFLATEVIFLVVLLKKIR